jgi:hypothetical protein
MGAAGRSVQFLPRDWHVAVRAALRLAAAHAGPTGGLALCVAYTSVADVPSDLAWRWQRTVSRLAAAQAGQTGGLGAVLLFQESGPTKTQAVGLTVSLRP